MGLGYSASFGCVQYSLLDGGMAYICELRVGLGLGLGLGVGG